MTMEELLNGEYSFKKIRKGEILTGEIISVKGDEVIVNINHYADGIIKSSNLINEDISYYNVSDKINVFVVSTDDGEGNVVLSEKKANELNVWKDLEVLIEDKTRINVLVKEVIDPGLVVHYKGIRGFIPRSRLGIVSDNLIGTEIEVVTIEVDRSKNRVIFSHIEIEREKRKERRKELTNKLSEGDKFVGTVKNIKDFGIFVDIGGIEGLVHRSQISHKRNFNILDMFKTGDQVDVCILNYDKDKDRLSLSIKALLDEPFSKAKNYFKVEEIYDVKIEKILSSGLIVELGEDITGFIHISELPEEMSSINKSFSEGQMIKAKILKIDEENQKISLSYNKVNEEVEEVSSYETNDESQTIGDVWKDVLSQIKE